MDGGRVAECERDAERGSNIPALLQSLWASQAAEGLPVRHPALSARPGMPLCALRRYAAIGLMVLIAGASAPHDPGLALGIVFWPLFAGLSALRLAAAFQAPRWSARKQVPDTALPRASILVALYREAAILPQLVGALGRIDYPADRLDILLVLEDDDPETLRAARRYASDGRFTILRVPPGTPRTKPRALNYALRFCRGEIVTVHDAEDRPSPVQLRTAAESFAAAGPELACLQAPLNWYNREECWLTRQFALEYAAHFHAMLPLYQRLGWPLPLGGTSNHFRTEALRRAGGWDAWNVTEDADLGIRLHRLGYRCGLIEPMTLEEAPVRTWPWICQRTRWLKGYAQTLRVHAGKPGGVQFPIAMTLGVAVLSALLHAPLMVLCGVGLVLQAPETPLLVLFAGILLSGYITAALCAARAMRRAGLRFRAIDLASMPAYWPLQCWAALRALHQLVRQPQLWEKTEHGVSRMTRRR